MRSRISALRLGPEALVAEELRLMFWPREYDAQPVCYWRTADALRIVALTTVGIGDEVTRAQVSEGSGSVRISLRVRKTVADKPALGVSIPVVITLREPLRDRRVEDWTGNVLPETPVPGAARAPRPCVAAEQRVVGLTMIVARADRVETKRTLARDLLAAAPQLIGPTVDPAELVCVVAVAGDIRQPNGQIPTPPRNWAVYVSTESPDEAVSAQFGSDGLWPAFFPGLPAR